jgi:glycosyltransferase involved in cell wall biosynthesis
LYGGTERVVAYLTEALVRAGHDVTLFASADSVTTATLVPCCEQALRLSGISDATSAHVLMLERVLQRAEQFDAIHFHIDALPLPFARRMDTPSVLTMHGRLDLRDLPPLFAEFDDVPLVSISDSQRRPLPGCTWAGTVYHGLPLDLHRFTETPQDYVAFIGRISPEKRVDRAIEIARRVGMPLKIAAKIDPHDRPYYDREVAPLFELPGVEYVGEIGEAEKAEFLGNARALLFPIDWPEPFGLVMIESFACGTPVVAYGCGSVPEVVDEGVTGFVVHDEASAAAALASVTALDRRRVRDTFERRFSADRMASDYVAVYERLVPSHGARTRTGEWPQAVA